MVTAGAGASDASLVRRSRRGDGHAFAELVERHQAEIFATALRLIGNRDDALAVTNAALYRAYQHLDEFEESRPLRPWLARIVSRLALDFIRDRARHQRHQEPIVRRDDGDEESPAEQLPDRETPEDTLVRAERAEAVRQAIASLPERQRQVVVLRYVNDLSYDEISQITGLTPTNVGVILLRSRAALKKLLDREELSGYGVSGQ